MITIAILVTMSVVFMILSFMDRRTDRLFMPRLAVLCGVVCAAATVFFDALVGY